MWRRSAFLLRKGLRLLKVILHIGAHRTGTTSLQRSLWQNRVKLKQNGVVYWGPSVTRGGRFSGLLRGPGAETRETARRIARNSGAIRLEMQRLEGRGMDTLLVSEENILGSMRLNLRLGLLYPGLQQRLARFHAVFGGVCTRIGLSIRPYDDFWASSLAYAIRAGVAGFDTETAVRLTRQTRSWRRVIDDVARAFPAAEVVVWEFDRLIGRPEAQFRLLSAGNGFIRADRTRHNASSDRAELRSLLIARGNHAGAGLIAPGRGRFMPFDRDQRAALAANYADDLGWLRRVSRTSGMSEGHIVLPGAGEVRGVA
jgi:hypothetical protein